MTTDRASIVAIQRYPVKGLSPEPLARVAVTPGDPLPHDRRYAVENGPSGFDPAAPRHLPKVAFLMLMRNEALARLDARFDPATTTLTVAEGGQEPLRADLSTTEGRDAVARLLEGVAGSQMRGPARVLEAPGFSFSDTPRRVVSLINLASVRALEQRMGAPVDPLRFRGNLHLEGLPPWGEFDLLDRELATAAGVRLRVVKRIQRCAATQVDPVTGFRDLDIPGALDRFYGHTDCGVYAEVVAGGELAVGDVLAAQ
ncbi:MOSC domain-containing protein [Alsobacter sp. SYSU M60028]|uniref:MOSC domain-containing protein n=1 Tax=Alsobacter ponti TaxID=2962936 RepID=A0ABT1LDD0_9HYPH|nr:MOSC domain-containing protein [Alsobacter ponti]MCP8938946.1 MOSC domain-containing protein [Alsobacter ponti]